MATWYPGFLQPLPLRAIYIKLKSYIYSIFSGSTNRPRSLSKLKHCRALGDAQVSLGPVPAWKISEVVDCV